jgi:hypothetical protein
MNTAAKLGTVTIVLLTGVWCLSGIARAQQQTPVQRVPGGGETTVAEQVFPGKASPMLLQADDLVYDNRGHRVIARGNVEIYQDENVLLADEVIYDKIANTLTAIGNVRLKETDGSVVTAERMTLKSNFRDGFARSWGGEIHSWRGEIHPEMCNVVQAAFMAVSNSQDLAYPKDMAASSRPIQRLDTFGSSFVADLGLGKDELSDLFSQQDKYSIEHFFPRWCGWTGRPQSVMDGSQPMYVTFSNPIFSSNSKLTIIEMSFRNLGFWGYRKMCVLRKTDSEWVARCILSWIR